MIRLAIGTRFGMLVLINDNAGKSADGHRLSLFRCDCGTQKAMLPGRVKSGRQTCCGCTALARIGAAQTTHGMRQSREYASWVSMKDRCCNPQSKDFSRYGGVGIGICDEWRASFDAFFRDMGTRPPGTSLDRIKNEIGYQPGNVRWATPKEQARNRRKPLATVPTPDGEIPLADYAASIGISDDAARLRLRRGRLMGPRDDNH